MNIQIISPDMALTYWPIIAPLFEKAFKHGQQESSLTDYMRKILSHNAQCWVVLDEAFTIVGAGLTEFIHYAQHKTLHIIVFSGTDFEEQSKMFYPVAEFAKQQGCKSVEQWGRDGWAKVLPKYIPGFKKVYTVMRYDLGETTDEIQNAVGIFQVQP